MHDNIHYVYIWFRPSGVPCYVGKGKGARWCVFKRAHNPHLAAIIRQAGGGLPAVIVRDGLTNEEAIETEIALIAAIGREAHGGPLVNLTDGGEGNVGWSPSPETRAKNSAAKRGRHLSAEHRQKISSTRTGQKHSGSTIATMKISMKGLKRTPEGCANIKAAAQKRADDPAFVEKLRANVAIQFSDPEMRRRVSESVKALWSNPEYRAQQMASRKSRFDRKRALESVLFIQGF